MSGRGLELFIPFWLCPSAKPIIDPKEVYFQNFNTELESQLYQELTCINTTIADVGKIKK